MGLPRKLVNFATFADGVNYMGEMPEVTLPKLTRKLEEYRAGGMEGPIDLDFGQEKMEAELKGAGWVKGLTSKWGAGTHDAVLLRFAGAIRTDDTEAVMAAEVVMRGRLAERDSGTNKAGELTEQTYKYTLSYYKEVIDGEVVIEIDLVNLVCIIDGEDRNSAIRAALGI